MKKKWDVRKHDPIEPIMKIRTLHLFDNREIEGVKGYPGHACRLIYYTGLQAHNQLNEPTMKVSCRIYTSSILSNERNGGTFLSLRKYVNN